MPEPRGNIEYTSKTSEDKFQAGFRKSEGRVVIGFRVLIGWVEKMGRGTEWQTHVAVRTELCGS